MQLAGQLLKISAKLILVAENEAIRRFRFHTCIGSGPEFPPFLKAEPEDFGVEACCPLADFATSRGRGADARLLAETVAGVEAEYIISDSSISY